MDNKPR